MQPEFLELLCSPGDLRPLRLDHNVLITDDGRHFSIRDGIACFAEKELTRANKFWQMFYDRAAFAYDATVDLGNQLGFGSERRIRQEILAAMSLAPGDMVVEIGCGTAANRAAFAPEVAYVGVDISLNMLRHAQMKCASRNWLAYFVQARAEALPIRSANSDLTIAMGVLQHVSSPVLALEEITRLAKSGASILLIDERRSLSSLVRKLDPSLGPCAAKDALARLSEWCEKNLGLHTDDDQFFAEYFVLVLHSTR